MAHFSYYKTFFSNLLGVEPDFMSWPLWIGFAILLVLSFIFEIIENARCTIEKYREASGTSSDYDGDSYQNIIADLLVVQAGQDGNFFVN